MKKVSLGQIIVAVATVATIVVNALASTLPLNGQTTGEISDRYPVLVVPAGYVFSIWGLIYLALVAFSIYQALPAQRENARLWSMGPVYVVSCVANVAWLVLWHYEVLPWTMLAMALLLVCLILIYLLAGIGRAQVSRAEKWLAHIPFSIYLGWITVATIANASTLLYDLGWTGWGLAPATWAVIILVVAAAIASAVGLARRDIAYTLVIVWAFAGIGVKHIDTYPVAYVAYALALLVIIALLLGFRRARRPPAG